MISDIAIYGAGGFGRETALLIHQINAVSKQWNLIGFFDDGIPVGNLIDGLPVHGGVNSLNSYQDTLSVVIAIADPALRKSIVTKISRLRIQFPTLIHPTAIVNTEVNKIGEGGIITANCVLTTGISIGKFAIVNLASTLGHDVELGDYCSIMPGSHISGNCKIGTCTMMGTGARMLQNLSIGSNCKIGAGAVLTKSFGDNVTVVGVPGRGH